MQEWFTNQVIINLGGHEALVKLLPPEVAERITQGPLITSLTIDILAYVLSFTQLTDVKSLMRTCKAFLAATRVQQFWHKHVAAALEFAILKENINNKADQDYIKRFNTWNSPKPETLREQVEWLFRIKTNYANWLKIEKIRTIWYIDRHTHIRTNLRNDFLIGDLNYNGLCWYASPSFNDEEGQFIGISNNHKSGVFTIDTLKYGNPGTGKRSSTKWNALFEGDLSCFDSFYFAHGSGKWTFEDGSILEGKGVAHQGEPRFILTQEEYKEVSRKRQRE